MLQKPKLIIIAGPNGSGKTTITQQILKHEWMEGCVYINPDDIAKELGYFIRLFYISTNHPSINASRIVKRVLESGHEVPISKIIDRYYKSITNCAIVAPLVDRLYVYDNSIENKNAQLLFRATNGKITKKYSKINDWASVILKTL